MTIAGTTRDDADLLARMLLDHQVARFYYDEAALLDEQRFGDWVQLFSDDTHYFMPLRRTVSRRQRDREFTRPGEMAFFDDTKGVLEARVAKLATGTAWAEDPPSRTRHVIANVRVVDDRGDELDAESNFILHRTRLKSEETTWVGSRQDTLRRAGGSFLIARRHVHLEQTVLLSQNLSNFF
ncbi:MAG TPA: 3-phenylpropionate/cinnamic acid dioxygenase subunit beta [Acidimicrobiales bacterium]|nr:3-phenylpropionate/cinnamic acid dioxygenase subunit beta [Acidimicrobiales bacterium]